MVTIHGQEDDENVGFIGTLVDVMLLVFLRYSVVKLHIRNLL